MKIIHYTSSMENHLKDALDQLGCTAKEIKLYLASYKTGPALITTLAKKARLQRSTAYVIANQLIEKQLISEDLRQYNKMFTATPPETVIRMLEAKKRRIGRSSITLKDHLQELEDLYKTSDILPKVKTYQGPSGMLNAWNDTLTAKSEILLWTNQATEKQLFASRQHQQFVADRVLKNISIRVLAVNNPEAKKFIPSDENLLRQTRLLPNTTTFSAETYLYDNKVVILDYNTDIITIIIENKLVFEAQKAMFELAWSSLKPSDSV